MNRTVLVLALHNCAFHSLVVWSSSEIYSLLQQARSCNCTGHLRESIFPKELKLGGKELKSLYCPDLHVVTRNGDIPGGKPEMCPLIYMYVIYAVFAGMLAQSEELPLLLIFYYCWHMLPDLGCVVCHFIGFHQMKCRSGCSLILFLTY